MLLHALVDSNIAYKASAGRLAGRSTIECWASAGTVIELVSDIVDATTFAHTQARLTRLLALVGDRILPDPDTLLVWYLGTPLPSEVVAYWVTLARRVASAAVYAEVAEIAEAQRVARDDQRAVFDEGVCDMIRRINPSADFEQWNVRLPPKQATEFRDRLWTQDALLDFAASFLMRRTADPPDDAVRAAAALLEPAYRLYRGLLYSVAFTGEKLRVNDGIDLTMALPLWQPDWIVVTDDARLRGFADLGGIPAGRFRALSEVL